MDNILLTQLQQRYQAETARYRMDRRKQTLGEEIAQARYDQRLANVAAAEYKGSLRSFLDKFSGKQADRTEELARQKRGADARLEALLREQENLRRTYTEATEALDRLPTREELLSRAGDDLDLTAQLHRLEVCFTAEQLLSLLDENYDALLEYRQFLQEIGMRILSREEAQQIQARPGKVGETCLPLLNQLTQSLTALGIAFEIPPYYRNPVGYIITASDMYRRDRLNQALDQVLDMKKRVSRL